MGSDEERQLTRDQFKVVDIPPEPKSGPKPVTPVGVPLRELEAGSDDESEPIVWLGSQTPSEVSEHEAPGPLLIEAKARKVQAVPAQETRRYTLRPVAERRARAAEERRKEQACRAGTAQV